MIAKDGWKRCRYSGEKEVTAEGADRVFRNLKSRTPSRQAIRRLNTNNFVGIGCSEAYAPARDSGGRGHEHLGLGHQDHQDQLSQRPGAFRPSSAPVG